MNKEEVVLAIRNSGANAVGILKAREFLELEEILKKRGKVSLVESDIKKRTNPFLMMKDAKSIIVCLFSYLPSNNERISVYAQGLDYHVVIKKRLEGVTDKLSENGYKSMIFCDNGPMSDRLLANLCGLGFFGKNGMLINERIGSYFFIAHILTDCELEEDKPAENTGCIGCNRCIEYCPGGALSEAFGFDENRCVSFLTQKKGELSPEETEIIKKSGYIWGCDICQKVCPHNKGIEAEIIEEFKKDLITDLKMDEGISNREFAKKFSDRAFSWRGKSVLKRNIDLFNE